MSLTKCNIHFTKQSSKTVYATPALLRRLKLRTNQPVHVKLGNKKARISLRRINKKGNRLYIPTAIRGSINLPRGKQVLVGSQEDNEIQLGPLIGIMTTSHSRSSTRPFGSKSNMMRQYLQANNMNAYYFAFSPEDINWYNETIQAYFILPGGKWERKTVPFPDVIYNRVTSRRLEQSQAMKNIKERFLKRDIAIFNWNFYDKWQIYNVLQSDKEAFKHVPESVINPSAAKTQEMLENHRFIYLKPSGGSLGKGIYRITYHKKRGYFVRYRLGKRNVLLRFSRFESMMDRLVKRRGLNLHNYVLQQGISLIELDGCPLDFRIHLNKNGNNEWVAAGIGAKKAGKGSVTTHVRTGGQLMTPEYALTRIYGEAKGKEMLAKAKKTTIKLAETIERNDSRLIGELGFDIGIDKNGAIWMFEANAKPGRSIFKHPALKEQGRSSLKYILEYSIYLSRARRGRRDQ